MGEVDMIAVKDTLQLKGITVLVCELFGDDVVTDKLETDAGVFSGGDFVVEDNKDCFSAVNTRNIVIRKAVIPQKINQIRFA